MIHLMRALIRIVRCLQASNSRPTDSNTHCTFSRILYKCYNGSPLSFSNTTKETWLHLIWNAKLNHPFLFFLVGPNSDTEMWTMRKSGFCLLIWSNGWSFSYIDYKWREILCVLRKDPCIFICEHLPYDHQIYQWAMDFPNVLVIISVCDQFKMMVAVRISWACVTIYFGWDFSCSTLNTHNNKNYNMHDTQQQMAMLTAYTLYQMWRSIQKSFLETAQSYKYQFEHLSQCVSFILFALRFMFTVFTPKFICSSIIHMRIAVSLSDVTLCVSICCSPNSIARHSENRVNFDFCPRSKWIKA